MMGITTYESSANFLFFHCDWTVDLQGILYKNGILIRDCRNFAGIEPGYYRVAVLTKEKNTQLIEPMKGVQLFWQSQS